MRLKIIFISMAIILIASVPVTALCQQRSFFLLGDVQQSVNFKYQYDADETSYGKSRGFSSSDHRFEENYHFQIPYAIYSPHLLKGGLGIDLGFYQENFASSGISSGTGAGINFQYMIDGILLDRKPVPVRFFSSSARNHVQRDFSGSYDLLTDSNGVDITYKNKYVPVKASYSVVNSRTSGQSQDRTQDTENFSIRAINKIANLSQTDAYICHTDNRSGLIGGGDSVHYLNTEYSARNQLTWNGAKSELISIYKYREASGSDDSKYVIWSENYSAVLGRALDAGIDYENTHNWSDGQRELSYRADGWLQHRLYQSLSTRMAVDGRRSDINDGNESGYGGSLNLAYHKNLPLGKKLTLNFTQGIHVTDSNRGENRARVIDEPLTARYFEQNFLASPNVVPGSISLRNGDPAKGAISYVVGIDYWVEQVGTQTRLIFMGSPTINDGDSLLVSYSSFVNPAVTYATYNRGVGGSFSVWDGRFRLFSEYSALNHELLAGRDDVIRLGSQHYYRIGFDGRTARNSFGAHYLNYVAIDDSHQTVEGFINHDRPLARGSLSLYVKDAYNSYDERRFASAGTTQAYGENQLKVGALYRRVLFGFVDMRLKGDYANNTGGPVHMDLFSVSVNMQMSLRNMNIFLFSQVNWQDQGNYSNRNEQIRLELTRFF